MHNGLSGGFVTIIDYIDAVSIQILDQFLPDFLADCYHMSEGLIIDIQKIIEVFFWITKVWPLVAWEISRIAIVVSSWYTIWEGISPLTIEQKIHIIKISLRLFYHK